MNKPAVSNIHLISAHDSRFGEVIFFASIARANESNYTAKGSNYVF